MNDSRQIIFEVDWAAEKSIKLASEELLRGFRYELLNYENLKELENIDFAHLIGDNTTDDINIKGLKSLLD